MGITADQNPSVPHNKGKSRRDQRGNKRSGGQSVAIGTTVKPATVVTALYEREDDVAILKQ